MYFTNWLSVRFKKTDRIFINLNRIPGICLNPSEDTICLKDIGHVKYQTDKDWPQLLAAVQCFAEDWLVIVSLLLSVLSWRTFITFSCS